jgi:NADH:ubiquinone oxidoreductase subunit F (NADH-binding)/ferredoxin
MTMLAGFTEVSRIGPARLTEGLDRLPRLDLRAHRRLHGRAPRMSAGDLITLVESVDLRGRGGAAFPFARKLRAVVESARNSRSAPAVLVNATEGEPASAKDKMLLIRSPNLVIGGALLAAFALGSEEIVIAVAGTGMERNSILAAVQDARLGGRVRVVQVPDRFISGEAGALVRAVNGDVPLPPGRKTHASDSGVGGRPTLLSNAETFAQLSVLATIGPDAYSAVGTPDEPGTVLLTVGGEARYPAVVETPTGVSLGAVLDLCGADSRGGILVGGYHGMWLPGPAVLNMPVSRAGLASAGGVLGAGVVLALGGGTCPLGEIARVASYLASESSGQCGPCKLGLPGLARAVTAIADGTGGVEALDTARRAAAAVRGRGACGHPDGASQFVLSALNVFTDDLAAHVFQTSCGRPVLGVLPLPAQPEQARFSVDWTRCQGHGLCAHIVPELVHLDRHGYPVFLDGPVPPWLEKEAQQAVEMCPALALRLGREPPKPPARPAVPAVPAGRQVVQLPGPGPRVPRSLT